MTASSDLLVFPQSIADSTRRAAGDPNPKSPVVTSSCAPHLVIPPSPRKHKSRAHSNNNNKQATSSLLIGFVYSVLPNRIVLTHCLGYLPYPEIKASQLPPRNWKKPFAKTTSRRPARPARPGLAQALRHMYLALRHGVFGSRASRSMICPRTSQPSQCQCHLKPSGPASLDTFESTATLGAARNALRPVNPAHLNRISLISVRHVAHQT
ncbi:hypothetical protein BJ166DRAFT_205107 [Pestalotiopsis sp. NC0098]|nr:hypothetical protein BJ166DRAFT_205107 [Pestalotiopsis sp. NC0098]